MAELEKKKYERFCQEYIIDYNGTQAAIRAGFKETSARQQATRLLSNASILARVRELQKEQVERIVIGKPTQPNGQPSENLARVENFFNRWRKAHPEVPIEYYDERFTSVLAHRAMIDGGVKKKTRRENKGLVDEISATIILQDFMQSRR